MAVTRVCLYTPPASRPTRRTSPPRCTASASASKRSARRRRAGGSSPTRRTGQRAPSSIVPGLQAALDLARDGRVDLLLVYRVDRLSRKVRQLAQLAELDTYEVVLRSATEPFDTGSAAGRMMLQMLAVFAEFEHATIVDRVSAGIERRAKEGRWYAGRPPFGYLFSDEDGPAPAAGWGHPAVHWIISNPTYVGKIRWRDRLFDAVHEPLVDELTFQRARVILRERGEDISRRRGNASDFLLSGVVRCGLCGKAYVGMSARGNGGRYEHYACSGRQKHGPKACRNERLPRHKLEHAVFEQLAALYRDEELVAEALAQAEQEAERNRPEVEQRLASIGAEIARAEQALERYYEAFEQGRLSPERCNERLTRLQARLEDLRAQQTELSPATPDEAGHGPMRADLAAVADQLEHLLAEGEPQKTKALLRLLIQELRVNGRAQIQPTYRLVTPEVCATSERVGAPGIEPGTSRV